MTHRSAALVALVGGALMALGSFMPWASIQSGLGSVSLAGTDGDGVFSLGGGIIVALLGLVHVDRPAAKAVRGLILVGGVVGLWIAVVDGSGLNERLDSFVTNVRASLGAGLYLLGIGSIAAMVGAVKMHSGLEVASPTPRASAGPADWHDPSTP